MAKGQFSHVRQGNRASVMAEPHCRYCKTTKGPFAVDHIVPPQKGGNSMRENLAKACGRCNASKNDRLLDDWLDHNIRKRQVIFDKFFGYTSRLRIYRRRGTMLDHQAWLTNKIEVSRKEHTRLTNMISSTVKLIHQQWETE